MPARPEPSSVADRVIVRVAASTLDVATGACVSTHTSALSGTETRPAVVVALA